VVRSQLSTSKGSVASAKTGGVVLEVEQVLCVPRQRSHPDVKVRALKVGHGLKVLLPYGVLLILNQEKRDR
jgi:hypothetical protein